MVEHYASMSLSHSNNRKQVKVAYNGDGEIGYCYLGRNKDDQTSIQCPYKWPLYSAIIDMKTGLE